MLPPTMLNPVPDEVSFETVRVAVPEFVKVRFWTPELPTETFPKLNELELTVSAGVFAGGLVLFDPVNPIHPVWKSPKTRLATKMLKTLRLLCPAEVFSRALPMESADP